MSLHISRADIKCTPPLGQSHGKYIWKYMLTVTSLSQYVQYYTSPKRKPPGSGNLACTRPSVREDDRKSERVTSGISSERDPGEKTRGLSFFPTRPHSSPARFFNPPLTESLEQALGTERISVAQSGALINKNFPHSGLLMHKHHQHPSLSHNLNICIFPEKKHYFFQRNNVLLCLQT